MYYGYRVKMLTFPIQILNTSKLPWTQINLNDANSVAAEFKPNKLQKPSQPVSPKREKL